MTLSRKQFTRKEYDEMIAREVARYKPDAEKVNGYECRNCKALTITRDVDFGTTPAQILCPACKLGDAWSRFYSVPQALGSTATKEFFRPTFEEYCKLSAGERDHVEQGGLLLRDPAPEQPDVYDLHLKAGKCALPYSLDFKRLPANQWCEAEAKVPVSLDDDLPPVVVCVAHSARVATIKAINALDSLQREAAAAKKNSFASAARVGASFSPKLPKPPKLSSLVPRLDGFPPLPVVPLPPSDRCPRCLYDGGERVKYCNGCLEKLRAEK